MPKAKQLPSGSYRTRIYTHTDALGKKHYKSFTASTRRESERLAAMYEESMQQDARTFHSKLDDYINSKEAVLSPSTIRSYKTMQRMIETEFPTLDKCKNITKKEIQVFVNDLAKTKSPKTVRNYYGLITASLGKEFDVTLPQKQQYKRYIPTIDTIKQVIEASKGTELYIPILLGANCMMRRGEIAALEMADIDGDIIHINKDMVKDSNGKWIIKPPKTESSDRFVKAPQYVIDEIKKQGYITKLNAHSITLMWDRFLTRNNFEHFRFHDLRHFGASYMHSNGVPDAYIQKQGGWKTDFVLKSVYRHTLDDEEARILDKINKQMANDFI